VHRQGQGPRALRVGVKVSVATTLKHSKGGQFVAHVRALPGSPYDGHTLAEVIPGCEKLVGTTIERLHGQCRISWPQCATRLQVQNLHLKTKAPRDPGDKREMRRRFAVEPVIGHLKDEHRMCRNYLAHRHGDLNNGILAAAGYNFRRLIKYACLFLLALFPK
jgi:transposase, IS5 family